MEEAIKNNESEAEKRFREFFDIIDSAVAVYAAVDNGADFVFLDFNRAAQKIEKIKREDVIGRRLSAVFPGAREMGMFDALEKVWRTGEPFVLPAIFYKDKRISGWRENHIYRLPNKEIVAVYKDLTEEKQREEELREKEEILKTITNSTDDSIGLLDKNLNYIYANRRHLERIGKKIEEVVGRPYREFHSTSKGELFVPNALKVVAEGKTIVFEHKSSRDGRFLLITLSPVKDGRGAAKEVVSVSKDITDLKKAEEKIKEKLEELMITNRLMVSRELKMVELKEKIANFKKSMEKKKNK